MKFESDFYPKNEWINKDINYIFIDIDEYLDNERNISFCLFNL